MAICEHQQVYNNKNERHRGKIPESKDCCLSIVAKQTLLHLYLLLKLKGVEGFCFLLDPDPKIKL